MNHKTSSFCYLFPIPMLYSNCHYLCLHLIAMVQLSPPQLKYGLAFTGLSVIFLS